MTKNKSRPFSLVDSTYRIRWEVTREELDNCEINIESFVYATEINGKESKWRLYMYPKGFVEKDKVYIDLCLIKSNENYKVSFQFGIETQAGFWPHDFVNIIYSRGSYGDGSSFGYTRTFEDLSRYEEREDDYNSMNNEANDYNENDVGCQWGYSLCTYEELSNHFVGDKLTIVASFAIYAEGESYRKRMKVADNFVDDIREISSLENLSDFTIISNGVRFPCYRLLLAARSKYFEALFRNEPSKKELEMDYTPELVKIMLDFMNKGLTTSNLEDKAMDLVLVSDMYCLDLLTEACQSSLVDNLSPDNAVETLAMIDKVKHVSKLEYRQKVLSYIKNEAEKVVKAKDWKVFVQMYTDLVTEIVLTLKKSLNKCSVNSEEN